MNPPARACPTCGKPLSVGDVCLICGASVAIVPDTEIAKPASGSQSIREGLPPIEEPKIPSIRKRDRVRFLPIVLITCVVLIAFGVVFMFCSGFGL